MNIPTRDKCLELLKEYNLSEKKIDHSILVADVALFLAKKLIEKGEKIDLKVLEAGALLHDIGRSGSDDINHPKEGERIAKEIGLGKIGSIIRKHALSGIIEHKLETWEEKLVYYSDKICKNSIILIHERTKYWPDMFPEAKDLLLRSINKAKELEKEIFSKVDFKPEELEKEMNR